MNKSRGNKFDTMFLIKTLLVVALFWMLPDTIIAQWNFSLSSYQEYNDNPFRSPFAQAEFISSYNVGVNRELGDFNLLYYGTYSTFNNSVERNYYFHQAGVYSSDENYIYGAYAEQRINTEEYNYFDQLNISGYVNYLLDFEFVPVTLLSSASYRVYNNMSEYDNVFLTFGISSNKSFETKTTLIMQAQLNYKNYFNSTSDVGEMLPTESMSNSATNLYSTQFMFNLRAAQSLGDQTGLAVFYTNRTLLNGDSRLSSDYTYNYGDESDLYDDPVSRNENLVGLELTHILPSEITLKGGISYSAKQYPTQGIYLDQELYSSQSERIDKTSNFYLGISKNIPVGLNEGSFLRVGLSYNSLLNKSNSFWYDYSSQSLMINLDIQF